MDRLIRYSPEEKQEIIKYVQSDPSVNQEDILLIEWMFMPIIGMEDGLRPKHINELLARNPMEFCKLVDMAYKSSFPDKQRELTDQQKQLAHISSITLSNWHTIPGTNKDGSLDSDKLQEWVKFIEEECTKSGHLEIAMQVLGKCLMYAPGDPDGLWIHKGAAEILNAKNAEEMRIGFRLELYNSRGVHSIDRTGEADRDLADTYRDKATALEAEGFLCLVQLQRG